MIQIQKSSLQEVNEILLRISDYSMTVPANAYEYRESIPHGFNFTPFYDYKTSYDGEDYYVYGRRPASNLTDFKYWQYARLYINSTDIYFHYTFADTALTSPPTSSFTLYYEYRLYIVEAKNE